MKQSFAQILNRLEDRTKSRMDTKVPSWAGFDLVFPTGLSTEQCSSEATATYKASLISRTLKGRNLRTLDLTGGLGVDSWAISKIASAHEYVEVDTELAACARENFSKLGTDNIAVHNCDCASFLDSLSPSARYDMVFIDPARRNAQGKKVFRLADCSPCLPELLNRIFDHTDHLLVKLSPMADITQIRRELKWVKETHILSSGAEVKELLMLLERDFSSEPSLYLSNGEETIKINEEFRTQYWNRGREAGYLYEPTALLGKSGMFGLPCGKFGLEKLAASTNLYVTPNSVEVPAFLLKTFKIKEILPFDKIGFKLVKERYPRCEVSARNVPISSDELRRRLGVKSGGTVHIFGVSLSDSSRILICTEVIA